MFTTSSHSSTEPTFLCLTICGYRKPGMSEDDYRHHMTKVSAPMTKGLMAKYGIVRWTQIHNQDSTRALMKQLYDKQMANIADFDCFSQVVFKRLEDYKRFKADPWYKQNLVGDHEVFADTKRSMMTIGWIEQFINDGRVVEGIQDPKTSTLSYQIASIITGSLLCGAMMCLSLITIPVLMETTTLPAQLFLQWTRVYHYGHLALPTLAVTTAVLYGYTAMQKSAAGKKWRVFVAAAATTLAMIPFTWIFMVPTNNTLFRLESESRSSNGSVPIISLPEAHELVIKWTLLHLARSLFPLFGAILGSMAISQKWIF